MMNNIGPAAMRFAVDGWDPNYGTTLELEADAAQSVTRVVADIEREPDQWAPITQSEVDRPEATIFVDGVRRIEARIWIDEMDNADPERPATEASAALCASYAAGSV